MNTSQILQDISSNLNRIVNFYIRGSKINLYFIEESIELMNSVDNTQLDEKLKSLFEDILILFRNIKNELQLSYNLVDDALTYSTLLSIHARKIQYN